MKANWASTHRRPLRVPLANATRKFPSRSIEAMYSSGCPRSVLKRRPPATTRTSSSRGVPSGKTTRPSTQWESRGTWPLTRLRLRPGAPGSSCAPPRPRPRPGPQPRGVARSRGSGTGGPPRAGLGRGRGGGDVPTESRGFGRRITAHEKGSTTPRTASGRATSRRVRWGRAMTGILRTRMPVLSPSTGVQMPGAPRRTSAGAGPPEPAVQPRAALLALARVAHLTHPLEEPPAPPPRSRRPRPGSRRAHARVPCPGGSAPPGPQPPDRPARLGPPRRGRADPSPAPAPASTRPGARR